MLELCAQCNLWDIFQSSLLSMLDLSLVSIDVFESDKVKLPQTILIVLELEKSTHFPLTLCGIPLCSFTFRHQPYSKDRPILCLYICVVEIYLMNKFLV